MRFASLALPVTFALLSLCCGKGADSRAGSADGGAKSTQTATGDKDPKADDKRRTILDWGKRSAACELGRDGTLVDFGDPSAGSALGQTLELPRGEILEKEGASWLRSKDHSISLSFLANVASKPDEPVLVALRARGERARTFTATLNGKVIGSAALPKDSPQVVTVKSSTGSINAGLNDLTLRFSGGGKSENDVLAELDWLHVGTGEPETPYAAPTRQDSEVNINLGNGPKRALALRGRSFARCTGYVPKGARFQTLVSLQGEGEGKVEVWLRKDGASPELLTNAELAPKDKGWRLLTKDIPGDGAFSQIEVVASGTSKGSRVLIGETRVTAEPDPGPPAAQAPARAVVLVIFGTVPKRALSQYGGSVVLPELGALAAQSTVFEDHRASSSLASASVASMLTGLPPKGHGLTSARAALPRTIATVQETLHQAGVASAMFSANPLTSPAFGFARGFDTFATQTPMDDSSAASVFDRAAQFVTANKSNRFFLVVHARGAHPPWDVSAEEAKDLPPAGYTGGLEPKHAGELLARARRGPSHLRFTDADRTRALSLAAKALRSDDAGLGRLLATLRTSGRDEGTAILVTGDVGTDEAQPIPYVDSDLLDEAVLSLPLLYRRDKGASSARNQAPSSSLDIARTVLSAFGLDAPADFRGIALDRVATERDDGTVRTATLGSRVSTRVSTNLLVGSLGRTLKFCSLAADTSCATDVRAAMPISFFVLSRAAFEDLQSKTVEPYEPALVDPLTSSALRAWDGR